VFSRFIPLPHKKKNNFPKFYNTGSIFTTDWGASEVFFMRIDRNIMADSQEPTPNVSSQLEEIPER